MEFNPKYTNGAWLSLAISESAIELDNSIRYGKEQNYDRTKIIKQILDEHYKECKTKGFLGYSQDPSLLSALGFDVIPKIFEITPKNCKKYEFGDYVAGLELILEQFTNLEDASKGRLEFLRQFMVDLGRYRLSRLQMGLYEDTLALAG